MLRVSTIERLGVSGPVCMMVADGMEGDWVGDAGRGLLRRLEEESFEGTERDEEEDDSVDAVVIEVTEVDPAEDEDDPTVMDDDCCC